MVIFFVRASVHVYFDTFKSPPFFQLGRLMSHDDSAALLLVSGDEANSVACVQTSPISFVATKDIGDVCTQATNSVNCLRRV